MLGAAACLMPRISCASTQRSGDSILRPKIVDALLPPIALGAVFSTAVIAGAESLPYGVRQLLAGVTFTLALILVVVGARSRSRVTPRS
jgi:hypothetical protein